MLACKSQTQNTTAIIESEIPNDVTGNFVLPPLSEPEQGAY